MQRYEFNNEYQTFKNAKDADPNVIGNALAAIQAEAGGRLSPDPVWKAAQDKKHPLHKHFEWNVQVAAEHHWRDTARLLIRSITIVDDATDEPPRRAYLSIAAKDGVSYRDVKTVMASRELQLALMLRADKEMEGFQNRYRELKAICNLIGAARKVLQRQIARREARAAA